ncbi:MAG: tetratricopeptide repeat protein [Anaerolineae bacterium]|nr:tetratricopeptide repeat protein [Anaerolineae bacterium]
MAGDQKKFQAAMAQAEQFSAQKNWAEASKAYRFALAEFPNNEAAVLGFGLASLSAGQTDIARKAFQHALKINPTNQQALSYIADLQERTGQLDAAAETYLRVGNIAASKNNLDTAIDFWQRATKLVPDQTDAQAKLAEGLAQQGHPRRAAREWLRLAAIFQRRNDRNQAVQQIEKAEQLLPDDPGITAAYEALQNNTPIRPDEISETPPPPPPAPMMDLPDENLYEDEDFFGEDPFAIEETESRPTRTGGLVKTAQQNALAELANVVFEDANNPNTMLIMQAIDLQGRKQLAEAAQNCQQALKGGLARPALYFNLGLLYKELEQLEAAAKMLKQAAQDRQYNLSSQFALGEVYHAANKLDSALKYFIEVVKTVDLQTLSGDQAQHLNQYYKTLADKYLAAGDVNKINDFITTLKTFFAHPEWEKKAYLARQRMQNVTENGVMSLAEYLESPETEVTITAMALTTEHLKRNMVMTASEECLLAIQKAPFYLPLHIRLADILLKQEKTDQAISKYLYVAKVYEMRNLPDQVSNIYQKILRLAPMDVTVRSKLIDLYISLNNVEQALDQYLILADSYYQLAQVDRALEKYSEASRLAASAQNADTWRIEILKRMGDIYNQRFDWARATAAYEELVKIKPNDERTQRELVDLYYKQNKINQAIAGLDNLLSMYQRQNPPKALELLRELVSVHPDDMSLRQRLAVAYAQNGMNREAIAEYDALGEMQLEHGLRDQAVQTIQAILKLGPDDAEGYHRLLSQISGGTI